MKKAVALILTALLLVLAGCGTTPQVAPGDGPAAQQTAEPSPEPSFFHDDPTEEPTDETVDEEPAEEEPAVASFTDKYTYEDGVEVEVTKITRGKVTRADAEYAEAKAGSDWVRFHLRVRNGSKVKLESYSYSTLTYGPDGDEAESPFLSSQPDDTDLSGNILPGRAKTATETYLLPAKYQDDPVLEFNFDGEHEPAIFTGSVK